MGHTVIDNILRQAEAGEPIRVVEDMFFSPFHSLHVAQAIHRVIRGRAVRNVSCCGSGWCSAVAEKFLRLRAVCPRLNTRFVGASSLQRLTCSLKSGPEIGGEF